MARARQGQDRWHRPEWGAPERPAASRRRWHLPLFGIFLVAVAGWFWQHPERLPEIVQSRYAEIQARSAEPAPPQGVSRLVYRWRDRAGVVQFTDQPPPEGVSYVQIYVDPATNTLPADTAPWPER